MPRATFVVPFGFDGAADRVARAVAEALARGREEIDVENVPGGGGLAGVRRANELAAGDSGPVLLLATPSTHVLLPAREETGAGASREFVAALGLGSAPNVLLVSPALGVRDVDELVARARRGDLVYASAGAGQTIHLCTALFCELAGLSMRHRPFDAGSATAYEELVAGRVHVYFDNLLGCRGEIALGHAVPLAVSAPARSAQLPEVPTLAGCGWPGHALDVWFGIFTAHAGAGLAGRLQALADDAGLRDRLASLGMEGGLTGAAALEARVAASTPGWVEAMRFSELKGTVTNTNWGSVEFQVG